MAVANAHGVDRSIPCEQMHRGPACDAIEGIVPPAARSYVCSFCGTVNGPGEECSCVRIGERRFRRLIDCE